MLSIVMMMTQTPFTMDIESSDENRSLLHQQFKAQALDLLSRAHPLFPSFFSIHSMIDPLPGRGGLWHIYLAFTICTLSSSSYILASGSPFLVVYASQLPHPQQEHLLFPNFETMDSFRVLQIEKSFCPFSFIKKLESQQSLMAYGFMGFSTASYPPTTENSDEQIFLRVSNWPKCQGDIS